MKKITAFAIHTTGEGQRAAYTYSIIDDNGTVVAQNKRGEVVLMTPETLKAANNLYKFLETKIPE